jgi:hypothetical protein
LVAVTRKTRLEHAPTAAVAERLRLNLAIGAARRGATGGVGGGKRVTRAAVETCNTQLDDVAFSNRRPTCLGHAVRVGAVDCAVAIIVEAVEAGAHVALASATIEHRASASVMATRAAVFADAAPAVFVRARVGRASPAASAATIATAITLNRAVSAAVRPARNAQSPNA